MLTPKLSVFTTGALRFYLQDAYNQDWVDNTMLFLEVADVSRYWQELQALNLPAIYAGVKVSAVQAVEWGKVCYVHDPAGILWHIGEFAA